MSYLCLTSTFRSSGAPPLIAQCSPLSQTLRRWGLLRLRRLAPLCVPTYNDSTESLHRKWMTWVEHESFKRLVYNMHLLASQISIALQTPPLVSYAEISLELPVPRAVWLAPTAEAWRDRFMVHVQNLNDSQPTFGRCIFDIGELLSYYKQVDLSLVLHVILGSYWKLIWDYRQLITITGPSSSCPFSTSDARSNSSSKSLPLLSQQGLGTLLKKFEATLMQQQISLPMETQVLYELLHANLHAPFEQLQLLAGMQGEQEARRAYPFIKRWFGSQQSRQAIWHAGQLLRATAVMTPAPTIPASARPSTSPNSYTVYTSGLQEGDSRERELCEIGTSRLRGFGVITVYNAWLVLWAYGLMSRARQQERRQIDKVMSHISFGSSTNPPPVTVAPDNNRGRREDPGESTLPEDEYSFIYLDSDGLMNESRRDEFINRNRGNPVIHATLLPSSWHQRSNLCRLEPQNDTEIPGGSSDAAAPGMVVGALPSDHSSRGTVSGDGLWKPEGLTAIPLHQSGRVVQVVIDLITKLSTASVNGHERDQGLVPSEMPFLAESLTRLMEHLSRAADTISV